MGSGNVYFIDVLSDPKLPKIHHIIHAKEFAEGTGGGSYPHVIKEHYILCNLFNVDYTLFTFR
jgi:hypothetical protein